MERIYSFVQERGGCTHLLIFSKRSGDGIKQRLIKIVTHRRGIQR